jgi:glyoxylase-like metal-dependent hydrolase (beta-lactamase superfamily II)
VVSASLLAGAPLMRSGLLLGQKPGAGLVQLIRTEADTAKIAVQPLRGNVTVLMGSGGNIAVLPGRDGKLLIDAGIPGSRTRITEAVSSISSDPIKHLVNTHWHFDHTDGNDWLHSAGATILAHENTSKHLSTSVRIDDWDFTFPPAPAGALPTEVFQAERTLDMNGATIMLKRYEPAHTDSDISVYFAEADVLQVADTWWNGVYPFIDYSTGGSIGGMIRATDANLARVTSKTIIVPGHGPVGNKSQLIEFREMLIAMQHKIAGLKKEGKSLQEVIAAKPTRTYDAKWGSLIPPDLFALLVYKGV